jgi:hypothetical protein
MGSDNCYAAIIPTAVPASISDLLAVRYSLSRESTSIYIVILANILGVQTSNIFMFTLNSAYL